MLYIRIKKLTAVVPRGNGQYSVPPPRPSLPRRPNSDRGRYLKISKEADAAFSGRTRARPWHLESATLCVTLKDAEFPIIQVHQPLGAVEGELWELPTRSAWPAMLHELQLVPPPHAGKQTASFRK